MMNQAPGESRWVEKAFDGSHDQEAVVEAVVGGLASLAGLGPPLGAVELARAPFRVCTLRLEGVHHAPLEGKQARELGRLLARFHRLEVPSEVIDSTAARFASLALYAQDVAARAEGLPLKALLQALESHGASEGRVLCHGDLKPANVLWTEGGPRLLDFESAIWAEPAYDLAQATVRFGLTAGLQRQLWEGYLEGSLRDTGFEARLAFRLCLWTEWVLLEAAVASQQCRRLGKALSTDPWVEGLRSQIEAQALKLLG